MKVTAKFLWNIYIFLEINRHNLSGLLLQVMWKLAELATTRRAVDAYCVGNDKAGESFGSLLRSRSAVGS